MALERERAYFEAHKSRLLAEHAGKYTLIKDEELVGTFDSAETAYIEGVQRFGNAPFLIRQVTPDEPVAYLPALSLGLLRAHS